MQVRDQDSRWNDEERDCFLTALQPVIEKGASTNMSDLQIDLRPPKSENKLF